MALVAGVVAVLALPSAGSAATRYAAPTGDGPATSCPEANPCSFSAAVTDLSINDGDEVVVLPGEYAVSGFVSIPRAIDVHGVSPDARPTLRLANRSVVTIGNPGARLSDLAIIGPPYDPTAPSGAPLLIGAGTAERLYVESDSAFFACEVDSRIAQPALLADSVCWNHHTGSNGAGIYATGAGVGAEYLARFVNVTAFGSQSGITVWALAGGTGTIQATNVIARGDPDYARFAGSADVVAETEPPGVLNTPAGAAATIALSGSNYGTMGAFGPATSVTAPGTGSNQTALPILASPAAGDFRQVAGSPTIDAGAASPLLGPFDFEGQARVQGPAVDVGADEGSLVAPVRFSAEARQRLRVLGADAVCGLPICEIIVTGTIKMKSGGRNRPTARKTEKLPLRNRHVVLTTGQRGRVPIEPASHKGTVKRALAHGAKVTVKADIGTGTAGVTERFRIRVEP